MSNEAETKIRKITSTGELERRWQAVRKVMKEKRLDFLIFQGSTDYLGGYVKWFTDIPAMHNYTATVIFPRDDGMVTIFSGARAPDEPAPPAWAVRGVKKRISVPIVPSLEYSSIFDAEKVVEELAPFQDCHIGLVGIGLMSAAFYKYITGHLTSAKFENATDLVDNIKAIKSDEEIECIRESCAIQDAAVEHIVKSIRTGMRGYDVYREIWQKCLELGSQQGIILVGSAPGGSPAVPSSLHFGNRMIEHGDQVIFLIETNGPSGIYSEILRIICIGKIPHELEEQFEVVKEAQKAALNTIKPGADALDIFTANNEFLRNKGYPEERRIFAHGQGYDLVERPSLNPGETMKVQARMNLAVHPTVMSKKAAALLCDNFLVHENGEKERLHKTPQKIFIA